ncbi:MAG: hypothetical protein RBR74_13405, partial [Ignavibacteriaceae bacterium]|nr:hypothetical protein [Ignavibacteriaceae bacterium]
MPKFNNKLINYIILFLFLLGTIVSIKTVKHIIDSTIVNDIKVNVRFITPNSQYKLDLYRITPSGKKIIITEQTLNHLWSIKDEYVRELLLVSSDNILKDINLIEIEKANKKYIISKKELATTAVKKHKNKYEIKIPGDKLKQTSIVGKFDGLINWPGDLNVIKNIIYELFFALLVIAGLFSGGIFLYRHLNKKNP